MHAAKTHWAKRLRPVQLSEPRRAAAAAAAGAAASAAASEPTLPESVSEFQWSRVPKQPLVQAKDGIACINVQSVYGKGVDIGGGAKVAPLSIFDGASGAGKTQLIQQLLAQSSRPGTSLSQEQLQSIVVYAATRLVETRRVDLKGAKDHRIVNVATETAWRVLLLLSGRKAKDAEEKAMRAVFEEGEEADPYLEREVLRRARGRHADLFDSPASIASTPRAGGADASAERAVSLLSEHCDPVPSRRPPLTAVTTTTTTTTTAVPHCSPVLFLRT